MIPSWQGHCNNLQNAVAITYKNFLQQPTKRSCKKHVYMVQPIIISCPGYSSEPAESADRIIRMLLVQFPDGNICHQMPCLLQRHLLPTSSSFFKKSISICFCFSSAWSIRFSAFSCSISLNSAFGLLFPRPSLRPSMPFSLYFRTQV